MIKVLITDDHPVVRRGIRQILEDDEWIEKVEEAGKGKELLEKLREEKFDVILLDISLPGGNGLDLIGQIKKIQPSASVLMLSIYSEELYAIKSLKFGASGYLTKTSAPEELLTAVHKVSKGERYISLSLADKLADDLLTKSEVQIVQSISARETDVLILLAAGKTFTQIATELSLSPKTISTYRARLLIKLKLKSTSELIRYAIMQSLSKNPADNDLQ
jgi:two-component system, NarL family, invasion response regulator UvrY